uniref:F-box domain-containing protein n=1 Tax=Davidia involucrata TaxID=16924 RepID=A0A5B6YJ97_DAVIN
MDERNHSSSDHDEEERSHLSDEQPPTPPKRLSCETLDRISALPDFILLHTLSLLPMKEVVKTGTLSKRWQYLWTSVPNLNFSDPIFERHCIRSFVSFVDRTLTLCRQSKINKFTIHFGYEPRFAYNVNLWIRFATSCDVEELDINLFVMRDGIRLYTLPKHLFTSSSLTKLGFWFCNVAPAGAISWKSLKNLSIWNVKLSEDVIENILSGSPALEFLKLCNCWGFNLLDITSASVRKFVIKGYYDPMNEDDDSVLQISAPYLQSLNVDGGWYLKKFQLMNMSSLVDVNLSFHLEQYEENENILKELLQILCDVNELTIGTWCLQAMSKLELKGLPSPVSKWKCLKIVAPIFEWNLPGIENLLQSSPNLETLIIDGAGTDFEWEWTYGKRTFKCLQLHLKTLKINIYGFRGWAFGRELPFIQFLLENALVLEKMIVCMPLGPRGSQNLLEEAEKLLNFPRSSPNAVVMFRICRLT